MRMSLDITEKLDEAHAQVTDRVATVLDQIAATDYVGASETADAVINDYLSRDDVPYKWQPGLFPALQFLKVYSAVQTLSDDSEARWKLQASAVSIVKDEVNRFTVGIWNGSDRLVNSDLIVALHAGLATQIGRSDYGGSEPIFEELAEMVALNHPRERSMFISSRDQLHIARSNFYRICEEFLGSGVARTIAYAGFDGINTALTTHHDRLLTPVDEGSYKMPGTEHSRAIDRFLED